MNILKWKEIACFQLVAIQLRMKIWWKFAENGDVSLEPMNKLA